jgi:hypothetical protein
MTRGTREKESASRALEEPDIAEEGPTDRTEANHLVPSLHLIVQRQITKWQAETEWVLVGAASQPSTCTLSPQAVEARFTQDL